MIAGNGLGGIAEALARRKAEEDDGVPAERKAAVAAILREDGAEVRLLLILRAEQPGDPWSGHMGLPGGRVDPGDVSPLAAALRETREELGLDLEALGRPLGRLSEVRTHLPLGSVPHSVVPFVFAIEGDPPLSPNVEVQEALWLPLPFLLDRGNRSWFTWERKGLPLPMPCYRWEGRVLWGLTLKIVDELLEVARG